MWAADFLEPCSFLQGSPLCFWALCTLICRRWMRPTLQQDGQDDTYAEALTETTAQSCTRGCHWKRGISEGYEHCLTKTPQNLLWVSSA